MPSAQTPQQLGSETVTDGIRVTVQPQYLREQSAPDQGKWVFAYHVSIRNEGSSPARLRRRHWVIVDADGESHEVEGEGVVGHTPKLAPGGHFQYASYCPLETVWGTMEGSFAFERDDGTEFPVRIGRFYLVAE